MTEQDIQIFLDKIKLANILIQKELSMISHVNLIKSHLKSKLMEKDRLEEYNEWQWAWQNISEMYDVLEYQYMPLLDKKDSEMKNKLEKAMKKYNALNQKVSYQDLIDSYDGVRKIMEVSKFHDVTRTSSADADFESEE